MASAATHFRAPIGALHQVLGAPLIGLLVTCSLLFTVRVSGAEPRFGDSTWVAPQMSGDGEPTDEGPRVAKPDRERTWETVLRTPFRIVFFPVRLLARGTEAVAGHAVGSLASQRQGTTPSRGVTVGPAFSYFGAAGPGIGPSVRIPSIIGPGSSLKLSGTWSTLDTREFRLRGTVGEAISAIGLNVLGTYDYRPNQRFFGIGNWSRVEDFSIYLNRNSRADAAIFFGRIPSRRIRILAGISDVGIGGGYHGTPLAENVFDPTEVPFLKEGSRVASYGLGGDFATVDRVDEPSLGIHLRAEARKFKSMDGKNLDYDFWRGEARGYLPVLSGRRVFALRLVYEGVDPLAGSDPVPFYRLPESVGSDRFSGFKSHRFRDQQLILAHAEYRWILWNRHVWALLLAQAGEVAPHRDDFMWDGRHTSLGGGLRGRLSPTTLARLELAHSDEGWQINLDLKGDF
jgi:hypothetical protein